MNHRKTDNLETSEYRNLEGGVMLSPDYSLLVQSPEFLLSFPSDLQLTFKETLFELWLKSFPLQTKDVIFKNQL